LKALILADACNPEWPSLPIVGYKAARAIANHADVVVATHVRNRDAIERAGGCGRAVVEYLDTEYVAAPLYKLSMLLRGGTQLSWTTEVAAYYPSYLAFEYEVRKRFGSELAGGAFDVIHRLTPMSPTLPSPIARWSDVPFVLGPINGGLRWPPSFGSELRREREYLTYLRSLYRWLPYHQSTYRRAAAILAAFQHTIDDLPHRARERAIDFPEVGIDPEIFGSAPERVDSGRVEFLFVGRLVPYKCPDVAVEAFARNPALRAHRLRIIGDGPMRAELTQRVAATGLEDCVSFEGWKSQAEVAQSMRSADVFVFPSIRELGAGVVVEAMACGCVPAVVDYGAPGTLVTPQSGVRVPLGSKAELVERFARALEGLTGPASGRIRLGKAARERAESLFTWEAKARKTVEVYDWVTGRRADRPIFEEPTNRTDPGKRDG
jgi:glycosyltransferase involved in cell wall biosynthesis